ncbi:MAG: pirin [Actinobacteria bacterium 13_2_20CM_2_71_6]|nr:MAG: pirin [Actinobacteria bacterium 13_2_20CM_2_71_6]
MPAISADPLTLPRLAPPAEASTGWRGVQKIVTARRQVEGEGFVVRRPFPGMDLSLADPFLLLDHMGAVEYAPGEAKGAPWHPHRGFETVTYMIDGAFEHEDSTGGGGLITDGATQWMTAGAGILHSELPPQEMVAKGGLFHGVQLWVNLPAAQKWTQPAYQDIRAGDVTLVSSADGGALVRIIAGTLDGHAGPGVTQTPIVYAHATLAPGARLATPWPADFNALVYVLSGRGYAGPERRPLDEGQLAVFGPGDALTIQAADTQPGSWEILLLGGLPIREPVARYGPFVMNTRTEIIQAVEDFQAGRLGTIPPTSRHLHRMAHRTEADEPGL